MRRFLSLISVALPVVAASLPDSARAADFYAGKTITMVSPLGVGGEYDMYLRLLQRFMAKYVPGEPTITVVNQPGAGGLLAANSAANIAPRDGTHVLMIANGLLLFQAIGIPGLQASLGDFNFIGNFSAANSVAVVNRSSGIRAIQDARDKEVIVGTSGAGSISALLPAAYNALAGTRFKIVFGYEGSSKMSLAMRSGELQGRMGNTWPGFLLDFPDAKDFLIAVSQIGEVRDPRLPDAPLLTEVVGADPDKIAVARLISFAITQNRVLAAPPGVPEDRVALLRAAFESVMKDPEYLAAATSSGLDTAWKSGAIVEQTARAVLSASPDILRKAKEALTGEAR